MRLKVKLIYECSEEMAHRQAEAAFEVCGEDHPFSFHRIRGNLVPRESASTPSGIRRDFTNQSISNWVTRLPCQSPRPIPASAS
jgi:hypothetical protein